MASNALKILTTFTIVIAFINFIYYASYWNSPAEQPKMQRINVHKKPEYIKVEMIKKESRGPVIRLMMLRDDKAYVESGSKQGTKVNWTPKYDCDNNVTSQQNSGDNSTEDEYKDSEVTYSYYTKFKHGSACPKRNPYLGQTNWKTLVVPMIMDKVFSLLESGGAYQPFDCIPTEVVAVIVPYRGEDALLLLFLFSLHFFLLSQSVEYQVFVIRENSDSVPFNIGKLFNIGFIEAHKIRKDIEWTCIIFHDPYLAPADSNNLYRCSKYPMQMVASVDDVPYELPLGGVIAMTPKDFLIVNGFSNALSNRQSVYNDMYKRLIASNYTIGKPSRYAIYNNLELNSRNADDTVPTTRSPANWQGDGLTNLSYSIYLRDPKLTCTILRVDASTKAEGVTATDISAASNK